MDIVSLFKNIPVDLQCIVVGYHPRGIFNLPELEKYDWFKLIRIIFRLSYERGLCSNEEMMKVYLHNCHRKSNVVCSSMCTIIKSIDRRLMICGFSSNFRLKEIKFSVISLNNSM
ncbi:MAG: hypothetical protein Harvfovirus37_4 [Harvfovirus sp.]|uniref:Uncharacterized protein n=1 Tax=Harvfovirus sp. TaxID=2487768 RepID=A0A3G5A2X3_9VIRU|nr:MAG: hypothetical protein Harvfovirus37_4 [Harvfovirus sp.]